MTTLANFSHAKTSAAQPQTRLMLGALLLAVLLFAILLPDLAHAASSGGSESLPWESPLQKFVNSMKGPVAFVLSLCSLIACFAGLAFGGEMSDIMRKVIYSAIGISGLAFATSLLANMFGLGAVV